MLGFREAIRLGADLVECDVHFSRDRQLVIIHDESVDRTTNGFGLVRELSLAELRTLDCGAGQRIPTLGELLDWIGEQTEIGAVIELKMDLSIYPGISEAVIEAIQSRHLENRVLVISADYATIHEIEDSCRQILTGILLPEALADPIGTARALHANSMGIPLELLSTSLVSQAHQQGLGVFTWGANTPEQIEKALRVGVDGIGSDYPDRLKAQVLAYYQILTRSSGAR
jgi:glycerophosphoryl diester phosphodiesterase